MNKKFLYSFVVSLLILAGGCSSILKNNEGVFGKAQKKDAEIDARIHQIEGSQAQSSIDKLAHIGAWSKGGVEHSLDQIKTNVPPEVEVAKKMNERIEALAGKPDFNEVKEIENIVDKLLSQVITTKEEGEKALARKDKEIDKLETQVKQLNQQREDEIGNIMVQADLNAQKVDQYKATLNQMDNWFGLGAIFYGVKKFIVSAAWILGIGSILFLILRVLSTSNPIAGAIFSIFDQVGSWFVHTIAMIFPKALSLAGNVSTKLFNSYKSVMSKFVDAVQTAKLTAQSSGKEPVLKDVLTELEKTMDTNEKAIVNELKKSLNWK